ncbi:ABC transporter ATP-binding protein [Clostridium sp. BNL1100]|uniref:ATP-binding cassette domain-containing protein n=1 Tax=Clostridium sp. BNL1100 TaxID=755731 RepID=UPI00024A71B4|nr:ABC transporter ATP-binding protein [Clostridium sp. BNL1100]AEY67196.1 ABC-type bacteriocin/lantibiotic exporter with N-terminal double-glycine peptidase domain [Clostridium sp. BNL1100]
MKRIFFEILNGNKKKFILLTLINIVATIISVLLPYLNGKFIDVLSARVGYNVILQMCLFILVIGLVNVLLFYVKQILDVNVRLKSSYSIKIEVVEHIRKIPILIYKKFNPSYLNHRTEQDINDIVTFIISNYATVVINFIQVIVLLFIILNISKGITLLMIVFLPIYFIAYLTVRKPLYTKSYEAKEAQNSYFNILNDQFTFMEDIKISANYEYNNRYIFSNFGDYLKKYINYTKVSGKFTSLDGIISIVFQVTTFLCGGWETLNGKMSVGELTIICTYFSMTLQVVKYYFELGKSYQNVKTSVNRLNEIFDIEVEHDGNLIIDKIDSITGDLTYKYEGNKNLIDKIKIDLKRGQVCSVVGKNGSGKSTISKLLIGILNTDDVFYNFQNINMINMKNLRNERILYISQSLNYPNRTICEMYKEFNEEINLCNIIEKIKEMNLNDEADIINLYENNWNKNVNQLSGGEKQIISVLKCIARDAEFIIFDEPTSNLDGNRAGIFLNIIRYLQEKDKLLLIITHDLLVADISDSVVNL